jgi:hypothetical protein
LSRSHDLLGGDADVTGGAEVEQIRRGRGVDGDERRHADEHQRLLVEP